MIAVIDYCKGNLKSVERGLTNVGGDAHITDDPEVIRTADALVLPGVGSFADASATMQQTGQMEAIRATLAKGTPFLGICLGEHLLFEGGTEHAEQDSSGKAYKIPHVGWNSIEFAEGTSASPLFAGIPNGEYYYFTHSYIAPESNATIATTTHSVTFPAAVQVGDRIFAVQFHPEKSSDAGARVLKNFVDLASRLG